MANSPHAHTGHFAATHPLGDRVQQLARIGDSSRSLGPEAALGVSIVAQPLERHYNLRANADTPALAAVESVLGTELPGVSSWREAHGGRTVVWLGPDEWLVLEPADAEVIEPRLREAIASGSGAVTEQTGQRISVLVEGDAERLLAKGTGLNLGAANFAVGSAVQGYLAQAIVVYLSRDTGIEVLVRSSFARYVADWLVDAAKAPLAVPAER